MMSKFDPATQKSLLRLPRRKDTWQLIVRRLATWIEMDDGDMARPYLTLLVNLEIGFLMEPDIYKTVPEAEEVLSLLQRAMRKPMRSLRLPPHRPQEIICNQRELVEALAEPLSEIEVEISYQENIPELDEFIKKLEDDLGGMEEHPGLFSIPGNTPELVGDFYHAAAQAYRQEPWIYLGGDQPVKYDIPALGKQGVVQLLGNSGIEYGLLLYDTWADLEQSFLNTGDPRTTIPAGGLVALSYVDKDLMSPEDVEAIEQYRWPIANPGAYPMAMIMTAEEVERPEAPVLQAFTALLRALPEFTQQLEPDLEGDYQPLQLDIAVPGHAGELQVRLEYPAGELHREAFPALFNLDLEEDEDEEAWDEEDEEGEEGEEIEIELPQFRSERADRELAGLPEDEEDLVDWQASPIAQRNPALVSAMALVYQAWDIDDPGERITLARQALEISPDCAEAYFLLAEDLAVNIGQRLKFIQKAVEAGQRAVGEEFLIQNKGVLWQHVEARPYLRALSDLSQVLWDLGRRPEALDQAQALLELDVDDPLDAKSTILHLLLSMNRFDEAYDFASGIASPNFFEFYSRALLGFRKFGDTPEARADLQAAIQANPYIPDFLIGKKRLPLDPPVYIIPGQESEAIFYSIPNLSYWRQTTGAIDWLRKVLRAGGEVQKKKTKTKNKPRKKR